MASPSVVLTNVHGERPGVQQLRGLEISDLLKFLRVSAWVKADNIHVDSTYSPSTTHHVQGIPATRKALIMHPKPLRCFCWCLEMNPPPPRQLPFLCLGFARPHGDRRRVCFSQPCHMKHDELRNGCTSSLETWVCHFHMKKEGEKQNLLNDSSCPRERKKSSCGANRSRLSSEADQTIQAHLPGFAFCPHRLKYAAFLLCYHLHSVSIQPLAPCSMVKPRPVKCSSPRSVTSTRHPSHQKPSQKPASPGHTQHLHRLTHFAL